MAYRVTFGSGQSVDFQNPPTQKDIEEASARLSGSSKPPTPSAPDRGSFSSGPITGLPGIKQAQQISAGIGSALGNTALNSVAALLKFSQGISNVIGAGADYSPLISGVQNLKENIYNKPFAQEKATIPGTIGTGIGTVAPYMLAGGPISQGANKLSSLAAGPGVLRAAGRVGLGALGEAAGNFGTGYAFSGGDVKQAKNQAIAAGVFKGVTSGFGELANAAGVPAFFSGSAFPTSAKKETQRILGRDVPDIAKWAADRGIAGTNEEIVNKLTQGLSDSEATISNELSQAGNPTLKLANPQRYVKVLQSEIDSFKEAGADTLAQGLQHSLSNIGSDGTISASSALGLRRYLDGLVLDSTRDLPSAALRARQAGLDEMANALRTQINDIGITGPAMKEYSTYLDAIRLFGKTLAKSKNNGPLGYLSEFLLGSGIGLHSAPLTALGLLRATLDSPLVSTSLGQAVKNLPQSSAIGSGITGAVSGVGASSLSGK